ncbi:MAG: fibronectin type III domain-containing protein, partial [Bacteroidota bacterium]
MKTLNKIYRLILLFALSSQLSMASVTPSNDVVAYAPLNDDFANAHELASIDNFCSAPGVFTTTGATPDEALPSNWTAGPHTNVWYKFTATTTEVSIRIEVGSMNFPRLALHDAAKSEIKSVANAGSSNAIGMSVNTLTVGGTYYINVSNGPNGGHSGTFVLCVDDAVSQDYPAGAVTLTHSNDNCSTLAGYNTRIGTPDGTKPSNWANGPNANVWFRFQATTSEVALNLNVSGSEGNMKFPRLALHDNTMQVLANVGDDGNSIDIGLSHTGLTIGDWYYVSVDNGPNAGHRGSFTLCIDTEASYDYPSGAIELTNTDNYCSGLAEFTTQIATPDGSRPSAWTNGPNANVWFTFIAGSADVTIDVKTGSSEGNVLYPKVALHDASLAELASVKDAGKSVDVSLIYSALTLGQRYYINIDNGVNQGHRGTFSLCVDNPGSAPSVPAIPTNLAAVAAGPDQINLSWDDVATETTYTIWRSTTSGAGFTALASNIAANTTTYNDLDLPANTQYFYYLEAVNGSGSSAPTAEVSATTDPVPVPPVPTNLAAVTEGTDQINLSWDDVSAETSYRLWRSTQSGIGFSVLAGNIAANTTTYSDQNLAPNTQYFYYLEAVNSSGSSAPTAEVNATTDQVPDPGSGTQRTFLIDLGNPTNGTTDNWNNITGPQRAGMTISGLVDATGLSSSLNFEVVSDASNGYGNGFNNTGYAGETLGYPTSANSDSYFSHGAGGTYKLTGLDNSKTYTITIFGSRTATSGGRVGTYTIDGVTQTLDGQNNTSNTISFTDLQPDVNNEITLDFGVAAGSTFGYLNVLEVVEKVATQTLYAVEWTNVTGADISAENLITNSQSTPGWNAGASSLNVLPVDQDGYIEFTATENNKNKIIGLSNIDLGTETNGIRYAFLLQQSGAVNVFESGLNKGNLGSYAPTDVFRITKNGQTIEYYINDMLVHTSTAPVELPLVVDLSLYSPGSSSPAINTTFDSSIPTPTFNSNVTWNNVIGAATDVNNTLSKTTGTSTQWDAGASSLNVLGAGADGWMEFMTDAGNQSRMIGLTYADIDTDFRTIRYALYLQSSGNLNVYESGINKGSFGTYGAGDIFRIERNAGTITYLKNGIVFYTSTLSSASTLMVDASLYTSASKVLGASTSFDTSITTPEVTSNVTWTNLVDVTVEADNVLLRSMGSGWNVGASTANVLLDAQDGWVSFYANKANDNKMIGMTDSDVDANFNTILYAVQLQNNATYSVYESGVHRGNFGAYGTGDEFRIERVGGTINYLHNGTTFYTSTVQNTGSLIVDTSLGSPGASFAGVNTSFGVLDQGTVPDHLEIAALKDLFELTGGSSWTSQTDADPGNDWAEGTEWDAINYIDQLAGWFGITLSNGDVIEIALGSNGLSGGTPSSIASLIGLTHLDFSYNDLTGPLLDELGDLSNLKVLILTGNQFTGSIPTTFSSLTQLERLSLDRNDLTGNIPIGFDSLQELQRLDIQQNRLSGGFSTLFSNLSELTRLDIGFNEFSGPIPTAIGNLSKLETLIMAGNGFDGSLPSSLGNLTSLTYLHLGNNDLSGEVPESLGNLTMLSSLNLSNNNFTGAIPASLVNLDNLSTLTLNFNALSELPPGMADMASLNSINVGSNALGFEDLEQFYSGPNTPKVSVTHSNQAFVTSAYAIGAVIG